MRKIIKIILSVASVAFFCYVIYMIAGYIFSLAGDNLFLQIVVAIILIAASWLGIYLTIKLFSDDTMQRENDECEKQKELQ